MIAAATGPRCQRVAMPRRSWPLPLVAALLTVASACSGGDDDDHDAPAAATAAGIATGDCGERQHRRDVGRRRAPPPTTTPPSLTSPATVLADTDAVGGSTLSTVDLATGAATTLGAVGDEVGVLGIAVDARRAPSTPSRTRRRSSSLDPAALASDRRRRRRSTPAARPCSPSPRTPVRRHVVRRDDHRHASSARPGDGSAVTDRSPRSPSTTPASGSTSRPTACWRSSSPPASASPSTPTPGRRPTCRRSPATRRRRGSSPSPTTPTARYGIDAEADELVAIADDGTVDDDRTARARRHRRRLARHRAPTAGALLANPG